MNLIVDCMQVLTGKPFSYFRENQTGLLLRLFRKARANPALKGYRKELSKIEEHLRAKNEKLRLWKDCEPYYAVDFLTNRREPEHYPYWIEMLKVQTGMKSLRSIAPSLPDGYYRLNHLENAVFEVREGIARKSHAGIVWKPAGFESRVFMPTNGLFTDILDARLYPDMRKPANQAPIKKMFERSLAHMRDFSDDVWRDFQDAISNVVLLTSPGKRAISSMSMRCKYFGAVFLNPFVTDEYKAVESLMHEYIHERSELWWEIQRPTGIPDKKIHIVSPMSGRSVRADVMIQAFIIYISALQYYRHVQGTRMPSNRLQAQSLNRRASHVARHVPALQRRLKRAVGKGTDIAKLFDYLLEVYEPLAKRP